MQVFRERFIGFFNRHVTVGDIGCSLSHLRMWEDVLACAPGTSSVGGVAVTPAEARAAAAEGAAAGGRGVDVEIVFEDDARPSSAAFTHLCAPRPLPPGRCSWRRALFFCWHCDIAAHRETGTRGV